MSISSDKGKSLETRIAKAVRRIGFPASRNARSGAGELYKADIDSPGFAWSIEAKNQATIKVREWWEQTVSATPIYKNPMLVVALDEYHELAIVRLEDILNLIKTNLDDTETIKELRG